MGEFNTIAEVDCWRVLKWIAETNGCGFHPVCRGINICKLNGLVHSLKLVPIPSQYEVSFKAKRKMRLLQLMHKFSPKFSKMSNLNLKCFTVHSKLKLTLLKILNIKFHYTRLHYRNSKHKNAFQTCKIQSRIQTCNYKNRFDNNFCHKIKKDEGTNSHATGAKHKHK